MNKKGRTSTKLFCIDITTAIATIGTPILPIIKKGFRIFPLIKNPRGKAKSITAKNLKEIK